MWSLSLEVNIFSPRDSPHEHSGGNSSSCTGNLVLRVPITRNHRAHSMSAFCRSSIWSCGQFHIRHSTFPFPPPQITWRNCKNSLIWKKFSRAARTGNDDLLVARVVDGHSTVFTGQALCRIIYSHGAGSKAANYLFPKTPYELPVHSTVDKLFEGLKKKTNNCHQHGMWIPTFATNLWPSTGYTFSIFLSKRLGRVFSSSGIFRPVGFLGIWRPVGPLRLSSPCSDPGGLRTSVPDGFMGSLNSSPLHIITGNSFGWFRLDSTAVSIFVVTGCFF